jgi:hypothetical protein
MGVPTAIALLFLSLLLALKKACCVPAGAASRFFCGDFAVPDEVLEHRDATNLTDKRYELWRRTA